MTWWRRRRRDGLMQLYDALDALGRDGTVGHPSIGEVPVTDIVGSMQRVGDFDEQFRLVNPALQERWDRLAEAMRAGFEPPPVALVRLGELHFVKDGHHRVSVARALGRMVVTARVEEICTVAYARVCVRAAHLPSKAAERRFLERVPLPQEVRRQLWLDEPAQWARLADTAEAWGLRRALEGDQHLDRCELAKAWWAEEVEPLVARLCDAGVGVDLDDVQVYVTALAVRDRLGASNWSDDVVEQLRPGSGHCRYSDRGHQGRLPLLRRARFGHSSRRLAPHPSSTVPPGTGA